MPRPTATTARDLYIYIYGAPPRPTEQLTFLQPGGIKSSRTEAREASAFFGVGEGGRDYVSRDRRHDDSSDVSAIQRCTVQVGALWAEEYV